MEMSCSHTISILILLLNISVIPTIALVNLSVITPVIIDETTLLSCSTPNETLYDHNGRTWSRQVPNESWETILHYETPPFKYSGKYKEVHGEMRYEYRLKIYNTSVEDINANYSCTFGAELGYTELKLNDQHILYLPKDEEIQSVSKVEDGRLIYNVSISKLFPYPDCNITAEGLTELPKLSSINITKDWIFYKYESSKAFLIKEGANKGVLRVLCTLRGTEYTDYDLHKESVQVFVESDRNNDSNYSCVSDIVICVTVSVTGTVIVVVVIFCFKDRIGDPCSCRQHYPVADNKTVDDKCKAKYTKCISVIDDG